ncbi:hypothetical protein KH5_03130 [Urechidicola sp. KH5]
MKKYPFKYLYVAILFSFSSCISDIDFDQVDDIAIETEHLATLVYFNVDVNSFLDDLGNELLISSDTLELPIFNGPYNENYLVQVDFNFEVSNTFDRDFEYQYEFLDEFYNEVYEFSPVIVPSNINNYQQVQTINSDIEDVLQTKYVVLNSRLYPGNTPLSSADPWIINFKSAVRLYYIVTVENE